MHQIKKWDRELKRNETGKTIIFANYTFKKYKIYQENI